jgi:hypothetical protein
MPASAGGLLFCGFLPCLFTCGLRSLFRALRGAPRLITLIAVTRLRGRLRCTSSIGDKRSTNVNRFLEGAVFASFDETFISAGVDEFTFPGFYGHVCINLARY